MKTRFKLAAVGALVVQLGSASAQIPVVSGAESRAQPSCRS